MNLFDIFERGALQPPYGDYWKCSEEFKQRIGQGIKPKINAVKFDVLQISGASVRLRVSLCDELIPMLSVELPFINQGNTVSLFKLDEAVEVTIK
jgi:hypothetical protein